MAKHDVHRDAGAVAEAHDVRVRHVEVLEHGRDVIAGVGEALGGAAVLAATVVLLIDGDHTTIARKVRQDAAVGGLDRGATARQQHQRRAARRTVHLVVDADAIGVGVPALDGQRAVCS